MLRILSLSTALAILCGCEGCKESTPPEKAPVRAQQEASVPAQQDGSANDQAEIDRESDSKASEPCGWLIAYSCLGAIAFGGMLGWMTRYILEVAKEVTVNSLTTVIGALGGAAITTLFELKTWLFPSYAIGLALGYGLHVLLFDIDPRTGGVIYRQKKTKSTD